MHERDQHWLTQAAQLGATASPHAACPNPRVGCLVVHDGRVIGQGAHQRHGGPHAEVLALNPLSEAQIRQATLYVTLEPCGPRADKKTPPCADLLMRTHPRRIVVGALDPHFGGQSIARLAAAGINAKYIANAACQALTATWRFAAQNKRSWLTAKWAQSLDGRAVAPVGKWLSNATSRAAVHRVRALCTGIVTTPATIIADDPQLTVRGPQPVLSQPDVLVYGATAIAPTAQVHMPQNRTVTHQKTQMTHASLAKLHATTGHHHLLTELGPRAMQSLLQHNMPDELLVFVAASAYGTGLPWFNQPHDLHEYSLINVTHMAGDVLVHYAKTEQIDTARQLRTLWA